MTNFKVSALQRAIAEANALDVEFHIVGADIEIDGSDDLPAELRNILNDARDSGALRTYLGADEPDKAAIDFLHGLLVEPVLVTDADGAVRAAAELSKDLEFAPHGCMGVDIETSSPGARPPPVRLNKNGALSKVQPRLKNGEDQPGLDPNRANIQTLQLYAGGLRCFVFRGEAIEKLLGSRWLRKQRLVAHSADFEFGFLRRHGKPPPGTPIAVAPIECTRQAFGLIHGPGRDLARASSIVLGIEPPKDLQVSCWAAPRLSDGQVAYAASDAVLAYQLWPVLRDELKATGKLDAYELAGPRDPGGRRHEPARPLYRSGRT